MTKKSTAAAPSGTAPSAILSPEAAFQLATAGRLPVPDLFEAAGRLVAARLPDRAVLLYRAWLANTVSPIAFAVHFNMAVVLGEMQDVLAAEAGYRKALELQPGFAQALLNLGTLLEKVGRYDEALDCWRQVKKPEPGPGEAEERGFYVMALNNLGRLLEIRKRYEEAQAAMTESLMQKPQQPDVITHWVHLRQKQCQWPIYAPFNGITEADMIDATSALAMLGASVDPAQQLRASQQFVTKKLKNDAPRLAPESGYAHPRLRVGYLSGDFCAHAVSILTVELYGLHDRARVEVYGFDWSREDGSPLRRRVTEGFDHHIRIHNMTDEEAAKCIRAHEIDILVDLQGLTSGTRPNILSYRPAPVQVTWLGFPGPTALPTIDYVLCDDFVLPPELEAHFTEKPLRLPHCFQINDRQREIAPRPTKASCNLPEDAFIFCSFNNNFKFTPEIFSTWMRILQRVPGSVLWLVADSDGTRENLCLEAEKRGIPRERLLFASRVMPAEYLARYQLADLFLDTNPFNAGTTASDALWAGLPVLTYAGKTFSSRMAGSLLRAVDLEELITFNLADYEELAVTLAQNPARIAAYKQKLAETRDTCALFDSPRFVRDLEDLFEKVAVRQPAGSASPTVSGTFNHDILDMMRGDVGTIVEVGCGDGALAQAYRQRHPTVRYVGIDKAPGPQAGLVMSRLIEEDVEELGEGLSRELGAAESWVFVDTLEHLRDPWAVLQNIRANAKGPVEIVACIPNAQNWGIQSVLSTGAFLYQSSGLLARDNLRWFTRLTILDMFNACGYSVLEMRSRAFHTPSPEMVEAIRQMAIASGGNPVTATEDALPYHYLVRAVANKA